MHALKWDKLFEPAGAAQQQSESPAADRGKTEPTHPKVVNARASVAMFDEFEPDSMVRASAGADARPAGSPLSNGGAGSMMPKKPRRDDPLPFAAGELSSDAQVFFGEALQVLRLWLTGMFPAVHWPAVTSFLSRFGVFF